MQISTVRLVIKQVDEIKEGDWIIFMPALGIATQVTGTRKTPNPNNPETGDSWIAIETAKLLPKDTPDWSPSKTFQVIEIVLK